MPQKYDSLSEAGQRLARIPRFGRLLGQMTEQQLALIDSRGTTYFQLLSYVGVTSDKDETGLIDSGLNTAGAELLGFFGSDDDAARPNAVKPNRANPSTRQWQARLALRILGAVAFEMACHNQRLGQPPTTPIEGDLQAFKVQVCQRIADAGAYLDQLKRPIDVLNLIENDFRRIEQMNALGLEYAVLSSTGEEVAASFGDTRRQLLFFADVSIQAFLAAYWAVNWTNATADVVSVSHWIPNPMTKENNVYQEFWEMVLEMPPVAVDTQRFQSMLSPLYDRNLQPDPNLPIRSTELIYRSWDRMQGSAAQTAYQSEFAALVAAEHPVARGLLYTETGESAFVQLADPTNRRDKWDTGESMMGDEHYGELRHQTVEPFRLHRYCVTNQQYELFDPRHAQHRAFTDVAVIERHPVVNVSWFDAWCYAKWLNDFELVDGTDKRQFQIGLPTEIQWEYACRCGETTPFTWWDRQNGERCQSGDCNFDSNYPWPRNQASVAEPIYLTRTIGVDGVDANLSVRSNPWGLSQMHGNVFEWTESWYTEGLYRVLRGGGWIDDGGGCRSGRRSWNVPSSRYWDNGFRLAAVLVSSRSPVGGAATQARRERGGAATGGAAVMAEPPFKRSGASRPVSPCDDICRGFLPPRPVTGQLALLRFKSSPATFVGADHSSGAAPAARWLCKMTRSWVVTPLADHGTVRTAGHIRVAEQANPREVLLLTFDFYRLCIKNTTLSVLPANVWRGFLALVD